MFIDRGSGNVGVGTRTPGSIFEVATGAQVSSSSGVGFLAVGPTSGVHCAIDSDDIQYFNGNAPTSMFLNYYGGGVNIATGPTANNVTIGRAGTTTTINGTFVNASDRNIKEGFAPVKTQEVLDRLLTMPVSTWSYKGADGERRHIGPMAQDFHAAFNDLLDLKSDDKTIAPLDEAGVAFTAIQGLNEVVKEKDRKIQDLEERLTRLEKMMEAR